MLVNSYNISKTLNAYNSKCHLWTYALLALRSSYLLLILFQNVNVFMFSYFEPNFFEKFHWERGFSNFGHVTIFAKRKFGFLGGFHFESQHFFNVFISLSLSLSLFFWGGGGSKWTPLLVHEQE